MTDFLNNKEEIPKHKKTTLISITTIKLAPITLKLTNTLDSYSRKNINAQAHSIDVQGRMAKTMCEVQLQSSKDRYMPDLITCTGYSSEEFNTWLLLIDKVSRFTDHYPKEICFTKNKDNFLIFLYWLTLHKVSWYSLKEKMHAEFSKVATASHTSLALIKCRQRSDATLTAFIYTWKELLVQSCRTTAQQCRVWLKIDLKINCIYPFEHLQVLWLKSIVPPVGIKRDASHILGKCPNC